MAHTTIYVGLLLIYIMPLRSIVVKCLLYHVRIIWSNSIDQRYRELRCKRNIFQMRAHHLFLVLRNALKDIIVTTSYAHFGYQNNKTGLHAKIQYVFTSIDCYTNGMDFPKFLLKTKEWHIFPHLSSQAFKSLDEFEMKIENASTRYRTQVVHWRFCMRST